METLAPNLLTASVARTASATVVPATKRLEVRWPKLDCSATFRSHRLSERAMNAALSTAHRVQTGLDCQRRSLALTVFFITSCVVARLCGGGSLTRQAGSKTGPRTQQLTSRVE